MSATLTPQGEAWAFANAATSITARIALVGEDWPASHRNLAIEVCNRNGGKGK